MSTSTPLSPRAGKNLILLAVVIGLATWTTTMVMFITQPGILGGIDFMVYRDGAHHMLTDGRTYDVQYYGFLYFTYPPFSLFLLTVISVTSKLSALIFWWILLGSSLVATIYMAMGELVLQPRLRLALAFGLSGISVTFFEPLRSSMSFGQINFLLMAGVLFACSAPRRGGPIALGLAAAMKLTPLMYLYFFAAERNGRRLASGLLTFVAATLVTWLILPHESATFWLHQAFSPGHKGGDVGVSNQSLYSFAYYVAPSNHHLGTMLWLGMVALTLTLGLFAATRYLTAGHRIMAVLALAMIEVLLSPISWDHHWSWVVLIPIVSTTALHRSRATFIALALLLAVSILRPYRHHSTGGWFPKHFGFASTLEGFSLVLAGFIVIIAMGLSELYSWSRQRQSATPHLDPEGRLAEQPRR